MRDYLSTAGEGTDGTRLTVKLTRSDPTAPAALIGTQVVGAAVADSVKQMNDAVQRYGTTGHRVVVKRYAIK